MTKLKHPVYPFVQFDVMEGSLAVIIDGDIIQMLDEEQVIEAVTIAVTSATPRLDLWGFFERSLRTNWSLQLVELFMISADYIEGQVKAS
jgi:hypothetical protein